MPTLPTIRPLLIAHRGDSAQYPENTSAAFDAAITAGVDGIELDLRPTRDGHVVVCHDASLARLGGPGKPLASQTLKQLQAYDIGSWFAPRFQSERLLSLDQLLLTYRTSALLLLELKAAAGLGAARRNRVLCQETVRAIQRHDAGERVLILCFTTSLLAAVRALDPRVRLVRNCVRAPRRLEAWLARQPPLHAIDIDYRLLTPSLVHACHRHAVRVFTWSCNTLSALRHARSCGVDGILSDRPAWLCTTVATDA